MKPLRKIVVLLHENDPYPRVRSHMIWPLCDAWREQQIEVEVVKGADRHVDCDVLFSHLDLSKIPDRYATYRSRYPIVINGCIRDITKRAVSANLVERGDGYAGPVVVKTNRNYGGIPELRLAQEAAENRRFGGLWSTLNKLASLSTRRFLGWTRTLDGHEYPVFPTVAEVPAGVFENEALVVERFLPERDGDLYCLRVFVFLGDRHFSVRAKSTEPIVKRRSIVSREQVAVPDEIVAARCRLGFDYGKFDYVINDGQVVLLDTNTTPGMPPASVDGTSISAAAKLADGIQSLWRSRR